MNAIEFTCWEEDKPLEIQLEPEAFCYTVNPGNTIKFIPTNSTDRFSWTLRITHNNKGVQLIPDPPDAYNEIEIYMNGKQIENIASS
ncbi:hypothetical protein [Pedobacter sp. SYSU D00535]|uniref:hypothetical protein n=1 Tax=Pedobacter sp. SYSU D00535 TaxID=2810308 RepID=UPI001A96CC24|nr:hypothetical protein [Pedobacter sp. SYSU D00535]